MTTLERPAAQQTPLSGFEELVRQHQSMVFSIALHYTWDRPSAEEVAQEVFLQLYRQLAEIESNEHAAAWLRRTAAHRSIDYVRKNRRHLQVPLEGSAEPVASDTTGDPMMSAALRRLIAQLPEKARIVMVLRYQEDMMPEEIARTLDMPVRTVKSHMQRSIAVLREKLGLAGRRV
jgi:RNA polymerase sigma-70 factor (ECF subfamily)